MTTKHTPGPWTLRPRSNTSRGFYVEPNIGEIVGMPNPESEANARLVAAAPDLLEACKAVLPYLNAGDALIVKAAISKATGE